MAFHEVRFPEDISEGSGFGPKFHTTITTSGGGVERRDRDWQYERSRGDLAYGVKDEQKLKNLLEFFRTKYAQHIGFRYKDPRDYTVDEDEMEAVSSTSDTHDYQIVKRYTDEAGNEYVREIRKPVGIGYPYGQLSDTVVIKVGGATKVRDVDYTIDYTTGIVTFMTGEGDSDDASVTCSCDYDVPVRFDTDELIEVLATYKAGKASVPIIQVKGE